MTPEEVGRALGEGWRALERAQGWWLWDAGDLRVYPLPADNEVPLVWWRGRNVVCPSPEHAVAVAHLLVSAEQVAGGAEVAAADPAQAALYAITDGHLIDVADIFAGIDPPEARRFAIDILRAAGAAESTQEDAAAERAAVVRWLREACLYHETAALIEAGTHVAWPYSPSKRERRRVGPWEPAPEEGQPSEYRDDVGRQPSMAELLRLAMSAYSEEMWCAGWMQGVEEEIWAIGGWHDLARTVGGWWTYERFVPLDEWLTAHPWEPAPQDAEKEAEG